MERITLPLSHEDREYLRTERDRVLRAEGHADSRKHARSAIEGGRRPAHWPELIVISRSGEFPPNVTITGKTGLWAVISS